MATHSLPSINTGIKAPSATLGILLPNFYDGLIKNFEYYADSSNIKYVGLAYPGTTENEEGWVIMKYVYDNKGNITQVRYAEGKTDFSLKWSERDNYNYK